MTGRPRRAAVIGIAVLVLALSLGALARADTTRTEYIAQAEPICRANTNANRRILKGAKAKAKSGKLGAAGRQFTRAATAFGSTVDEIAALPQPTVDTQLLTQWIGYLRLESSYLSKVAVALKHGQRGKAEGFAIRLNRDANLANQVVTSYGFTACLIKPNEFT